VAPVEHGSEVDPADVVTESIRALREVGDKPGLHVRLFGTPHFFRLWLAQVVSSLGDWLGFLAITVLATRVGGGNAGAAVGLVMTARIVPGFFLGPLAGVLVDRWDRKKVMVTCDLARAAVLCLLPFVDSVAGLVACSLLMEVFTMLWSPAKEASVPNLVPPDRLASANSLSLGAAYGTLPVASVLFTVLAGAQGAFDLDVLRLGQEGTLAFYVDALTFCGSAFLIYGLALGPARPTVPAEPVEEEHEVGGIRATIREFREGWSFIFGDPVVRAVNVGLATGLIGGGMVVPLGPAFADEVLGAGAGGYGALLTALGVGAVIGIVSVSVTQQRLPRKPLFTIAVFGSSVTLGLAAATSTLGAALGFVVGFGLCAGVAYVVGYTLLHEHVDDQLRGRIFGALNVLVRLCLLIAFAVGPFLSDILHGLSRDLFGGDRRLDLFGGEVALPGVRLTLWLSSLIIFVAAVLALLSLRAERRHPGGDELPVGSGVGGAC
jgi:dTMP kinase